MTRKVELNHVKPVRKPPDIQSNRSLWTRKDEQSSKLIQNSSFDSNKFKKGEAMSKRSSISSKDKCISKPTNNNNGKKHKNKVETDYNPTHQSNNNGKPDWKSNNHSTAATDTRITINQSDKHRLDRIKSHILNSAKAKHKHHTNKLKFLQQRCTTPKINLNTIDPSQIENSKELTTWLTKHESKKNYTIRKATKSMTTQSNFNRFSVLASSASEDETEHPNPVTPTALQPDTNIITAITGPPTTTQLTISTATTPNLHSNTIMTQTPRSSIPPPLPTVQPWQKVGEKQDAKEERYNNEEYSNRFAPMYLPTLPKYDTEWHIEKYTKNVLPVTVRVTAPKNYKVKNGRVIIAILRALQIIDPTTYIGPIVTTTNSDNIQHPSQVPTDEDSLSYYLEEPSTGRYKNYSTRIYICTNHELEFYKKYQDLIEYLGGESISLEYNDLDSVIPPNIGFIENQIARPETIKLHHNRIKSLLPANAPKFSITVQSIHGPDNSHARVFMLKCNKRHVS
jgi:hypothetical protein